MSEVISCFDLGVESRDAGARNAKHESRPHKRSDQDRLVDFSHELQVMLEEAGNRTTLLEAVLVISTCLDTLCIDHPRLQKASVEFKALLTDHSS